ncbi:MAG: bifunctional methylenetetrahydrofolate dehydrogenase/methenyltetrahydrofolate cyclohydrolase FolD [Syntrophales bacterium]|nr:bifunctional methylenetetrahydrofolate dehydrogenase/methenyltetrahydrofolate cyclohydrolase FolD [Syntrophales bacterium]
MAVVIDGNAIARSIREDIREKTSVLKMERRITPGLAVILVGSNPASEIYVGRKKKACEEVGFLSRDYLLPEDVDEKTLINIIDELNEDPDIHGILVQLPLPGHIRTSEVLQRIDPQKDVDGFHPLNMGLLLTGKPLHTPCTPKGIMELLDRTGISVEGKEAVIVGRSNIVGKPTAILLLNRNATVTICHTRTRDLPSLTRRADILIVAVGRAEMIKGNMVKEGAVVIDVGVNRLPNGKVVGDVDFQEVSCHAAYITPVPGGVGPMTIAMLLDNTLNAAVRSLPGA